jgi:glycerate dehydrogenase
MRIVVLDGYTLNPGDLSWGGLEELGEVTVYDRTPRDQVVERAKGAQIIFTNKTPVTAESIAALPDLKFIGVLATGYNIVDVEAAAKRGIPVSNIPIYGTASVAQMAIALLLELAQHVGAHSAAVRAGEWASNVDWCFWKHPLIELAGMTMGIIGFGRIGRATGKIANALGMKVVAADAVQVDPPDWDGFAWLSIEDLLKVSDVISLHCPLTPEVQGLINRDRIELMKPSAFLINTSRGPLIVDQDLADALNSGRIAGAGLDVLSVEPPKADNPLLSAKNCIQTPHIAWATSAARARLMDTAIDNARSFIAGKLVNVVNGVK